MPQLLKAAPTIDVDGLKEANSIRPAHYVRSFHIEHQANSGSCGPSNWKAVEEFCGFNRENLEEFQRAAKEQMSICGSSSRVARCFIWQKHVQADIFYAQRLWRAVGESSNDERPPETVLEVGAKGLH